MNRAASLTSAVVTASGCAFVADINPPVEAIWLPNGLDALVRGLVPYSLNSVLQFRFDSHSLFAYVGRSSTRSKSRMGVMLSVCDTRRDEATQKLLIEAFVYLTCTCRTILLRGTKRRRRLDQCF